MRVYSIIPRGRDHYWFTRIPCNQWVWPLYLAINRVLLMAQLLIMNPQFCRDNDTGPTVFVNDCDRFLDIWYSPMFAHICVYIYTHVSLSLYIYMYIYICIYIYTLYIHLRGRCHIMDWMQVANFLAKVRYIKVVHTLDIVYIVRYQLTWFWMILGGVTISRLSKAVFDIAKFEFPRPYFTRNLVLYLFDGCCKHMGIHIVAFTWDPRADWS